jgi:hypothetical protein
MTVDPTDDCTFWFSEEYLKATGVNQGFNWSTAIGSFSFPGCGGGGGPAVTLVPTSLTWAKIAVGKTSGAKNVVLTNSGSGTLDLTSIVPSGDFILGTVGKKKACGSTVAPGASCTIAVKFTPTQTGVRTGDITITDNAANSPQTVPLTGTGK